MITAKINELRLLNDATISFFNCNEELSAELVDLFSEIIYGKSLLDNAKIEALQQRKTFYYDQIANLKRQLKELRHQNKLIFLNCEARTKLKKINKEILFLEIAIEEINKKIASLEREKFYTRHEKKDRFTKMLLELNFRCSNRTVNSGLIVTEYSFCGNEKTLFQQVEAKTKAMKNQRRKKITEIFKQFGCDSIVNNYPENNTNNIQ